MSREKDKNEVAFPKEVLIFALSSHENEIVVAGGAASLQL
jgi:hypothetical protein